MTEEESEQVAVIVPPDASVTLAGHETAMPVPDVAFRDIVPAKPERLPNVRVSMLEEPELKEIDEGPEMLKSVMLTATVAEWLNEPLVPVIVRV